MSLKLRTRLNISPAGRGRILLISHENQLDFVENEFIDEILRMKDCAVYYYDSNNETAVREQPDSVQVIMILITGQLLEYEKDMVSEYIELARKENIPLVPVLKEQVPLDEYEDIFGKVQFITWFQENVTQIPYKEKMNKILDRYVIDDKLREKIIQSFRKRNFLSYRKVDRALAKELMRKIHDCGGNCDVAIWYDEMLVAGDEYDPAILDELNASDLFLLLVTPNVLKNAADGQANYVERIEIPTAKKCGKMIMAVEMLPMQEEWKERLGLSDSQIAPFENVNSSCAEKLGSCSPEDIPPEKQYYLGMAYSDGILVEKNPGLGTDFLKASANGGCIPAIREMKDRYFYGNNAPQDYERSLFWLDRLIERTDGKNAFYELETDLQAYMEVNATEAVNRIAGRMLGIVRNLEDDGIGKAGIVIDEAKILSYLADYHMREGRPEEAVSYARKSCTGLEALLDAMRNTQNDVIRMMNIGYEKLAMDTLAVNYDHLADYLGKNGQEAEARLILDKHGSLFEKHDLFRETDEDRAKNDFYELSREAELCVADKDMEKAVECMEKALQRFESIREASAGWEIMQDKAKALYRLANYSLGVSGIDEAVMERVEKCLSEAWTILDEILKYNPQNTDALRDKSLCLQIFGIYYAQYGRTDIMASLFDECEKLREAIAHAFPSAMAEADIKNICEIIRMSGCYCGRFLLSNERTTDAGGNPCAILNPASEREYKLMRNVLPDPLPRPAVPTKSVLRSVRTLLIGEQYNVGLSGIGAEILISEGAYVWEQSLILYEITDSSYRKHYALFFSPAALEARLTRMYRTGHNELAELLHGNGGLRIGTSDLMQVVMMLAKEFFNRDITRDEIAGITRIMRSEPYELSIFGNVQLQEIDGRDRDGYYLFSLMTES